MLFYNKIKVFFLFIILLNITIFSEGDRLGYIVYYTLLEFYFYGYQTYQMIMLSFHQHITQYLIVENYATETCDDCVQLRKRMNKLFSQIRQLHFVHMEVSKNNSWFLFLVSLTIVNCTFHVFQFLSCLINKYIHAEIYMLYVLTRLNLSYILLSWINIFFITLLNDMIKSEILLIIDNVVLGFLKSYRSSRVISKDFSKEVCSADG